MTRLSDIEGAALTNAGGVTLGTVEHGLFHPAEPRMVALQVGPVPLGGLVPVRAAFVPISSVGIGQGVLVLDRAKLPSRARAEREIGHDPEATVIWRGMPVASEGGPAFGAVADAELGEDWSVETLIVSTGAAGDLAHGRLRASADLVVGFDGRSVVVRATADELESRGGGRRRVRHLRRRRRGAAGGARRGAVRGCAHGSRGAPGRSGRVPRRLPW
jgi:hypothetical protein